jgi:hypothetical protein
MNKKTLAFTLFWIGFVLAVAFAGVGTYFLMPNLRTLTPEELSVTIWADDGPLFILWGMAVPLGSILAGIGAFTYVKTKAAFPWLTGFGVFGTVFAMIMVWNRVYNATMFGIGGSIILLSFFAVVWIWIKKYAGRELPEKVAGSFKLVGYLFWINTSWFLCGETARMHLKVYENSHLPSPIEIMVFLVLGWIFVLIGDYKEMRLKTA